jgi:GT2 family glycosyltransferase
MPEDIWIPPADSADLMRTLAVIPTFRNNSLTWAVVEDCLREPVRVVVVDNSDDYQVIANEMILCPGHNLGWLRANNLAITKALQERSCDRIVLLNNDIRLSAGFFAGIIWAEYYSKASIVAASYDDSRAVQRPEQLAIGQRLTADQYSPRPRNILTGACDGTAVSIRCDALERIGLLDEEQFGKYGWGGVEDLCFRARSAGLRIIATRAAYAHHIGGGHQTASQVIGNRYLQLADAEGNSGMSQKWGPHWKILKRIPTQAEVDFALECEERKDRDGRD